MLPAKCRGGGRTWKMPTLHTIPSLATMTLLFMEFSTGMEADKCQSMSQRISCKFFSKEKSFLKEKSDKP